MEWTDLCIVVPRADADTAIAVATAFTAGGLYIEDYADMEQQVLAITHMDLIEEELRARPRDVVKVHVYVSPDENAPAVAELLRGKLLAAGVEAALSAAGVRQEDWETSWKQYYHAIEVGARLAVVPSWEAYTGERTVLRLDPGMAFGTGTHETTFLCLEILDGLVRGGEAVLDVGTGSGILSVAALLLGAQRAHGIDIDPLCVRTARENAQRNGVEGRFVAELGDLAQTARGPYDLICANIVADAIIRLAPGVGPLLAPGGHFVASGIITERQAETERALAAAGLRRSAAHEKNGWAALVYEAQAQGGPG